MMRSNSSFVGIALARLRLSILLGLLVLPLGEFAGLPWRDGALFAYSSMTDMVDAAQAHHGSQSAAFYARFGFLPLACLIGAALIGLRFCAGIEAALPQAED